LTKLFPDYPEVDKAYYRIGLCSYNESLNPQYTQEETIKSAEAFERFIDKFPNNEKRDKAIEYIRNCHIKLIHKSYYNGYIYYKLKDYSSAELYLKEVIESQLHDEYEKKSYYYLAKIYKFWNDDYMLKQIMGEFEKYFADSAIFKKLANQ
ncbi:MAG: tetratricopeptide repeat protein, partial [Candidatus Cloacimonadota bacterium]|nr:tetratricopeptide repeat protein [Candidatus Cloacimonadota bacterium]